MSEAKLGAGKLKIRHLYLIVSLLWALILGPTAGLIVFGTSAGIVWLYVFGDNPWPTATDWILPFLGIAGAVMTAIAVIWIGYQRGKQREASPRANPKSEWRRAMMLLIAPVFLMLLAATAFWINARNYREAINDATMREMAFADLIGANQKVVGVTIGLSAERVIRAAVRISGQREGDYRLNWRVVPSSFSRSVIAGDRPLKLGRGDGNVAIDFSMDELQRRYQAVVLGGRGGALVDERFQFEVILDPVLTHEENLALPPGEQQRIEMGD